MIRSDELKNVEFGVKDVDNAFTIWGEAVPPIQGKMKRKHPAK